MPLTGSAEQVLDDIGRLRDVGVTTVVFRPGAPTHDNARILEQLHRITDDILPRARE